ncbi:hypothetical protein EV361DRAFT_939601 [Lentinula raphanica]|uniref:Uncharacterized protein n=1 Tax=Lentinula raphanica TaxID=153919 RepID=A0AA38P1J6_9AGAR|nr:hypothetical protein F5878DRAFT_630622 [Lentinula raphanica]KAJ3965287.1 hypothetical protein EV361DRAFT_939601 [Lentinula raphanica]
MRSLSPGEIHLRILFMSVVALFALGAVAAPTQPTHHHPSSPTIDTSMSGALTHQPEPPKITTRLKNFFLPPRKPNDFVTDQGIHATLHISSKLGIRYDSQVPLVYKRPVQKLLDALGTTFWKSIRSKHGISKSKGVQYDAVITRVIKDDNIKARDDFILVFSLYDPKKENLSPSVFEDVFRYTGQIDWANCVEEDRDSEGIVVESRINLNKLTGELRDQKNRALVSYQYGKPVDPGSIKWGRCRVQLFYHPDHATKSDDFKDAFVLAVQRLLASVSSQAEDNIREQIPNLPELHRSLDLRIVRDTEKPELATDQDFQIALISVFDQHDRKWSVPSRIVEPVYAGRIDWKNSLKKNSKGQFRLRKDELTGEIRDLEGNEVLFERGQVCFRYTVFLALVAD